MPRPGGSYPKLILCPPPKKKSNKHHFTVIILRYAHRNVTLSSCLLSQFVLYPTPKIFHFPKNCDWLYVPVYASYSLMRKVVTKLSHIWEWPWVARLPCWCCRNKPLRVSKTPDLPRRHRPSWPRRCCNLPSLGMAAETPLSPRLLYPNYENKNNSVGDGNAEITSCMHLITKVIRRSRLFTRYHLESAHPAFSCCNARFSATNTLIFTLAIACLIQQLRRDRRLSWPMNKVCIRHSSSAVCSKAVVTSYLIFVSFSS